MPKKAISMPRKIAPFVVIVVSTLCVAGYKYDESTRPNLILGPMVQMPAPDQLAVVWTAKAGGSTAWITFTLPDGSTTVQAIEPTDGRYVGELSGLKPGAKYQYELFNAGMFGRRVRIAGPLEYKSPAAPGTAFRFVAFGDSGVGGNSQSLVANMMAAQKPDLVIHTGDLIYPAGAKQDYPLNFYEPNRTLIAHVPFMASLGNHDIATDKGAPLLAEFILPRNGPPGFEAERNYYFDYGDARFVALDSNQSSQGGVISAEQMATQIAPWVRSVLTDCSARWKFAFFHHPYYTGSSHGPKGGAHMKQAFATVFEDCGVDVVFCGHNHLYERTAPMKADKMVADGEGVVYITTGAGGAHRYPETVPPPPFLRTYNDQVFSFTCVDVSPDRVEIRQLDENGNPIDDFVIRKPAKN